jgi:hypothetical protein
MPLVNPFTVRPLDLDKQQPVSAVQADLPWANALALHFNMPAAEVISVIPGFSHVKLRAI